jgi:hypothetical protein
VAVDTLRGDLAEIRLLLDDTAPRSEIEALQRDINELAERADESRRNGNDAAAVASIERRLTEIRDALCILRPAEGLIGMARVVQQASRKIETMAGAWDQAVLEQLGSAVAAMRGIAAQAASPEALAKLSNEVCALGAKLDDAQRRADGRIWRSCSPTSNVGARRRAPAKPCPHPPSKRWPAMLPTSGKRRSRSRIRSRSLMARWRMSLIGWS